MQPSGGSFHSEGASEIIEEMVRPFCIASMDDCLRLR